MNRLLVVLALVGANLQAADGKKERCSLIFNNDSATSVQIVNPHKHDESFVVETGQKIDISPMANKWWAHFVPKTLHIYVADKKKTGGYELAYKVKVHHCREGWEGKLSMKQIEKDAGRRGNDEFTIERAGHHKMHHRRRHEQKNHRQHERGDDEEMKDE